VIIIFLKIIFFLLKKLEQTNFKREVVFIIFSSKSFF